MATTRTRARAAKVKSARVFWIDISAAYEGYAIWKEVPARVRGRKTPAPVVCLGAVNDYVGCPDVRDPEFKFSVEELEGAFAELTARKKAPDDGYQLPYGDPVPIGATGIELSREDRYEYLATAQCGEDASFRAGELRALISAVRELEVSTVAV